MNFLLDINKCHKHFINEFWLPIKIQALHQVLKYFTIICYYFETKVLIYSTALQIIKLLFTVHEFEKISNKLLNIEFMREIFGYSFYLDYFFKID